MLLIIDSENNVIENYGANSGFPDYELQLDADDNILDVTITRSLEEYQLENQVEPGVSDNDRLADI